jgi:hypothetical protein
MLAGLDFSEGPVKEIVLVSPAGPAGVAPFRDRLARTFTPSHVLAVVSDDASASALAKLVPLVAGKTPIDGKPTAYVCERRVCKLPTTDVAVFAEQIAAPKK